MRIIRYNYPECPTSYGQYLNDQLFPIQCGNDVSNRAIQAQDGQWLRGKSFPTYKPLGPWIETHLDPSDLTIQALINGLVVQSSNTKHLLFCVPKLIAFLSGFCTLYPGDIIMTGPPPRRLPAPYWGYRRNCY